MKRAALDRITKISKYNLDRISKLKMSGYEPNDYIILKALDLLEKNKEGLFKGFEKRKLDRVSKIGSKTLAKIEKLKISGYEPNDFVIGKALDLLENE